MKMIKKLWIALAALFGVGAVVITTLTALADAPVLSIQSLGTNQFSITITNGVTNEVYVLYWTPTLSDPDNYPFALLSVGDLGQTNWAVDGTGWDTSFFRVQTGTDWDADGIPNWQDADPNNPSIGILSVTIDSPLNGTQLQ